MISDGHMEWQSNIHIETKVEMTKLIVIGRKVTLAAAVVQPAAVALVGLYRFKKHDSVSCMTYLSCIVSYCSSKLVKIAFTYLSLRRFNGR